MDGFGKNYYIEHRNDGRKYVRCRNRNLSGLKCSFCKRYDHFKNWFNANNTHVCHYSEIENNLDNLFQKEISKDFSIEKIRFCADFSALRSRLEISSALSL